MERSNIRKKYQMSRPDPNNGQTLTEYTLLLVVVILSLVIVNKFFIEMIGQALKRIVEIVSLPVP